MRIVEFGNISGADDNRYTTCETAYGSEEISNPRF